MAAPAIGALGASKILGGGIVIPSSVDTQGAIKGLKSLLGHINKFADRVESVGKRIGGFGTALAGMLGGTIKLAAHVEEVSSKFNNVFRENAVLIREWAREYALAFGQSGSQMEEWLSSVQDILVPMGIARDVASSLSIEIVKLAGDVASFNNLPTDETLQLMISGLMGGHRATRRFGVALSEARIKQELLNMGINKSTHEITEQEKMMARLRIMFKDTTDAQGDLYRTSHHLTLVLRSLKAMIKDLGEEIGAVLAPRALEFVTRLRSIVIAAKSTVKEMPELIHALMDLARTAIIAGFSMYGFVKAIRFAISPTNILAIGLALLIDYLGWTNTGVMDLGRTIRIHALSISGWFEFLAHSMRIAYNSVLHTVMGVASTVFEYIEAGIEKIIHLTRRLEHLPFIGDRWKMANLAMQELIDPSKPRMSETAELMQQHAKKRMKELGTELFNSMVSDQNQTTLSDIFSKLFKEGGEIFSDAYKAALAQYGDLEQLIQQALAGGGSGIGVPTTYGVAGFFGGATLAEHMGFAARDIQSQQLNALKRIAENTGDLVNATRHKQGGMVLA